MKNLFRVCLLAALVIVVCLALPLQWAQKANAQEPVTITLWTLTLSGDILESFNSLVSDFEAANSGIKLKVETRAGTAHMEAVRVALNTSQPPDLYFTWSGPSQARFYVDSGGVEPLDDYYKQYGWDSRFSAVSLKAVNYYDKYYGIPYAVRGMGLYYRKDLFEKAGITSAPTTYDELMAANAKLKAAGLVPLSLGGKFGYNTMRLLDSLLEMSCGAQMHDDLKQLKVSWADQECVTKAYQELRRWVDEGYLPQSFLGIDPSEAKIPVYKGEAAMQYEGDWHAITLQSDGEDLTNYDFFVFPTGTERLSFFVEMYCMAKNSQHKDEAAKFMDYWTSTPVQTRFLGRFSAVSPNLEVKPREDQLELHKKWAATINSYKGLYFPADQDLPNRLQFSYFQVQDNVVSGSLTPAEAAKAMQVEIEAYKKNPQDAGK